MSDSGWALSAFGDEIADDLHEQLRILRELKIGYLELRGAWGKNVLHLTDDEVIALRQACAEHEIAVSAIGSPVGKSPITQPFAHEMANLTRIFAIAHLLDTQMVRVFSFYPPAQEEDSWTEEALIDEAVTRVQAMTNAAAREGIHLVLENENGIVGDTVARCAQLLSAVPSANLGFAWDPANFVHVGEAEAVTDGWELLGPRTHHVHVKDYNMASKQVLPAGEGDGQMDLLLTRLRGAGYNGLLALEPHLTVAGHSSGFSGPEGMARAADALRGLMARVGVAERRPAWAGSSGR